MIENGKEGIQILGKISMSVIVKVNVLLGGETRFIVWKKRSDGLVDDTMVFAKPLTEW